MFFFGSYNMEYNFEFFAHIGEKKTKQEITHQRTQISDLSWKNLTWHAGSMFLKGKWLDA